MGDKYKNCEECGITLNEKPKFISFKNNIEGEIIFYYCSNCYYNEQWSKIVNSPHTDYEKNKIVQCFFKRTKFLKSVNIMDKSLINAVHKYLLESYITPIAKKELTECFNKKEYLNNL